jgi:hypothetical protein
MAWISRRAAAQGRGAGQVADLPARPVVAGSVGAGDGPHLVGSGDEDCDAPADTKITCLMSNAAQTDVSPTTLTSVQSRAAAFLSRRLLTITQHITITLAMMLTNIIMIIITVVKDMAYTSLS